MAPPASTSRQASKESLKEQQYHHFIPRFILRRFRIPVGEGSKKGKGKKKHFKQQDHVHYFDFETCRLEERPVGRVYGVMNLYKDAKNIENAYHLEEMLARLESSVGVVIKKIHDALEQEVHEIKMERKEIEGLRKFLFVMQYREAALSGTYYDENHPELAEIGGGSKGYKSWVERVKEEKELEKPIDIWLYFLEYFLNTPHHAIMARAVEAMKRRGASPLPLPNSEEDEALEDFPAVDYMGLTGTFYLGILEAADGCEFVLCSNSFGIWEGTFAGVPCMHRLFVISPRVVLLLRKNEFRPDDQMSSELLGLVNSSFMEINMPSPVVEYKAAGDLTDDAFVAYKLSDAAQHDLFNFSITKLTKEQTENVNLVTMVNVIDGGAVTFRSKDAMIGMLQRYRDLDWRPGDEQVQKHDVKYASLESQLLQATVRTGKGMQSVLDGIISGEIECESEYDRAYKVYKSASREEAGGQYILDTADLLIAHFTTGIAMFFMEIPDSPDNELVKTLPKSKSAKVMTGMKDLISSLEVDRWHDPAVSGIFYDAAIVGSLEWLVKNGKGLLDVMFPEDIQLVVGKSGVLNEALGSSLPAELGQLDVGDADMDTKEMGDSSQNSVGYATMEIPAMEAYRDMKDLISSARVLEDAPEVLRSHPHFEPGPSGVRDANVAVDVDTNKAGNSSDRSVHGASVELPATGIHSNKEERVDQAIRDEPELPVAGAQDIMYVQTEGVATTGVPVSVPCCNEDTEQLGTRENRVAEQSEGVVEPDSESSVSLGNSSEGPVIPQPSPDTATASASGSTGNASDNDETAQQEVQVQDEPNRSLLVRLYHGFGFLGGLFAT
ncbi:hypothetical protein AMATHDRAFT_5642 [Amanita thiersii Skay4041]|uniref:DUF4238 domain-containing protein n=1 Tax=Amanita thiersii Skay4041 TaxID=703135 RepID=A0A2A9NLR0_9AGAR|nr:hypothetical protein AMATHDRAFT_5642 [Amanita thiersii Skay4041]